MLSLLCLPKDSTFIFVYGTLMASYGQEMHLKFKQDSFYVGTGLAYGRLYLVSSYPGMVKDSHKLVVGEVYKIRNKKIFTWLDEYEGLDENPPLYTREIIWSYLPPTYQVLPCWAYLYNRPTSNLISINSGNFAWFWK